MTIKLVKFLNSFNATAVGVEEPLTAATMPQQQQQQQQQQQHHQHHHQPPPPTSPLLASSHAFYATTPAMKQHNRSEMGRPYRQPHQPHLYAPTPARNGHLPALEQPQHLYNPYMQHGNGPPSMDDDDNMSLYSTAGSGIMTSRDHPFNNSQRPLLGGGGGSDRSKPPALLNKKKLGKFGGVLQYQPQPSPPPQQQHQQHHYQLHSQQQQQGQQVGRGYISPYVQAQKRDSAKGLHGFNDFDILSQQYNAHLQSPHIGYPYGSPPSPTARSNDFVFDTVAKQQQPLPPTPTPRTPPATGPRYANIGPQRHRPQTPPSAATTRTGTTESSSSASASSSSSPPSTDGGLYSEPLEYYHAARQPPPLPLSQPPLLAVGSIPSPARFEDDFCTRRNVDFDAAQPLTASSPLAGPYIFGVPPEQQIGGGKSFQDATTEVGGGDTSTVIIGGKQKISAISDASSNSHDSSGSSKRSYRFLLRKRKQSKKSNAKDDSLSTARKENAPLPEKEKAKAKTTIKCVVVGDCGVGKTNLILSYLENRFNPDHVPTASDIYNADVMVNDSPVHLTLCDTAGQDTLDPLRELCYPDSDVFLLCFAVAKPETFRAIKTKWAPRFAKTKAALILVGTQSDLRTNVNVLDKLQMNGERPISYADAWDLATTIGAKYIETSSATQDKVKDVFDTAIWEGLAPTSLPPTPRRSFWRRMFCLA